MITLKELIEAAKKAASNSYSPYSNFRVGSAVEFEDGTIYSGTNIENASYGLTICAERNAIFQAAAKGNRKLKTIVIYAPSQTCRTAPCGACRQVIKEFADDNTMIICVCDSDESMVLKMEDLLPKAFGPDNLLKKK